jgi:hypothetical protein
MVYIYLLAIFARILVMLCKRRLGKQLGRNKTSGESNMHRNSILLRQLGMTKYESCIEYREARVYVHHDVLGISVVHM